MLVSSDNLVYFGHPGICRCPPSLCLVPVCSLVLFGASSLLPTQASHNFLVIRGDLATPLSSSLKLLESIYNNIKTTYIYINLAMLHWLVHGVFLQSQCRVKGTFPFSRGMVNTNQTHTGHGVWRATQSAALWRKTAAYSVPRFKVFCLLS